MPKMFDGYWERMKLREEFNSIKRIPVKKWYPCRGLNEIEKVYFDELKGQGSILDIGSGTNLLQRKFCESGYEGVYHTLDLSREFSHDYYDLAAVDRDYDAIVLQEVIEHMSLDQFGELLEFIDAHLAPEGKLVISTTQPRSVIPWEAWDMTHVQHYPLHDLYALFRARGFTARCYRVWTRRRKYTLRQEFRLFLRKVLCYVLGVDHVDSAAIVLHRQPASAVKAPPEPAQLAEAMA